MEQVGRQLSHFRLREKLGQGGMGAVYRAEDTRLGRQVAIKLLPPATASDPRARKQFLTEAQAVSALEHPHICLLYEFDEAEGQPFIAMQLVEGETLKETLERGPLSEDRTRQVLGAVASALAVAHAHGIVHRDVKSENVLLGNEGGIKLSDFGVARLAEATGLTTQNATVGTPAYMAPEHVSGGRAGTAADQFSLAVVGYECLSGTLPFSGETVMALMYQIMNAYPEPPSKRRSDLSRTWDSLLARALAKDPIQRFPSILDFARAVAETAPSAKPNASPYASGGRSLAVLYFDNLSGDPEADYFCAGITEDILTDLSKIPGLRVSSLNSVARYRGQTVDLPRVAADLGVEAVVEGSARRAGNRVRITAQLINASDGFHLWSERYDRTLDDVLDVQEDIARSIAGAIRGTLTPEEAGRLQRGRPSSPAAYDLYLKGCALYRRFNDEDNRRALHYFEQAVAAQPDYALAWAHIAGCCGQMHNKGYDLDPEWLRRGLEAAGRAVTLDPRLPESHRALADILAHRGDRDSAMAELRRALDLDPRFEPAMVSLGVLLELVGDLAGRERHMRTALNLDPVDLNVHGNLTDQLIWTRRYAEAIEQSYRYQAVFVDPINRFNPTMMRAWALINSGDLAAVEGELRQARHDDAPTDVLDAAEAFAAAVAHQPERARALLSRNPAVTSTANMARALRTSFLLETAGWLGDESLAVRLLREYEVHPWYEYQITMLRLLPGLSRLRDSAAIRSCFGERGRRLVWPIEAPPLSPEDRAQFTDYSEANGLPQ